jgi:hypothetical protein
MSRKLWVLNFVLAAAVVWAGIQLRGQWKAANQRKAAMMHAAVKPAPVGSLRPEANPPAVIATDFKKIADDMLFDPSRNPNVPVEPAPPPPPPVPTPPLPVYHGFMNIGDGPMAIMSVNAGGPHVGVHPGEQIGEFKLISIDPQTITLQWQDRVITKSVDELANHLEVAQAAQPTARTDAGPPPAAAPPPQPTPVGPQGDESQFGTKPCALNDSYAEGAVVDGFRKVIGQNPFGKVCFWERAK